MSRTALVVISFALSLTVAESAVRLVSASLPDPAPWPSNETELKARQLASLDDPSFVVLGSSVSEAAIDPAIVAADLGRTLYNAATPFATQDSLRLWAERFVFPRIEPEVVLVGLPIWSPGFGAREGDGRLARGIRQVDEFHHPEGVLDRMAYLSHLIRWRSQLKSLPDLIVPTEQVDLMDYWTETGHQTGYYGGTADFRPSPLREVIRDFDLRSLGELVSSAKQRGYVVVLFWEPTHCDASGVCLTASQAEKVKLEYRAFADGAGVMLVDELGPWPPTYYADGAHFNREGTVAFSHALSDALARLGL